MAQANAKGGVVRPRSALGGKPQAYGLWNGAKRTATALCAQWVLCEGPDGLWQWGETDCNWPLEKAG